jgi:hypothetical protein
MLEAANDYDHDQLRVSQDHDSNHPRDHHRTHLSRPSSVIYVMGRLDGGWIGVD